MNVNGIYPKKSVTAQGYEKNRLMDFTPKKSTDQRRPCECSRNLIQTYMKNMSQQNLSVDLFSIPAEIHWPENDLDPSEM